jgi:solute carrier family 25 aspartate/glutamate transporter 12/13
MSLKKAAIVRDFCMSEEKWGMDTEKIQRQKRRAALAALAVAGYVSVMLPASAAEVDFPAPSATVEALEAQFNGSTRVELEREIQIQRKEWELPSDAIATAPSPTQNQQSLKIKDVIDDEDSFYAWKQVQKEIEAPCVALVQDNEDDVFSAWKLMQREMGAPVELECISPALLQSMEEDSFYAWKQIQKEIAPVPKSPVKKAVAASVAVAVAGSVAGAASAVAGSVAGAASVAGRAVASSGGTNAVATSLTVLQHSALPGSTLLAKVAQHLGGGGVAGAIGATAVYPLDTIKTRMQAQSMEGKEPQYKDEIDCFKQLVAKEGPASLYSGLVPQLLGIAPEKAMKLTVNEALLSSLETMMPGARVWALEFIAGGGGGASQVVFTNPMEIVKVRLQTQKDGAPKKELWTIVKELGVKGLYDGAGVTLARDVPSSAIFFAIYTLLRGLYPDQSFLAGAIAAIPATILVTPMDIIKTRLQKEPAEGEQQFTDWWECLQDIVKNEGPQALFKGSLLRVLRTSPQFGITLMVYGILTDGS